MKHHKQHPENESRKKSNEPNMDEGSMLSTDENAAGTTHLNDPLQENAGDNTDLQVELQEQKDKYLRLFAEFDNFRKRSARERVEYMQTAGREVITSLLEVLDDADRTEKMLADTPRDFEPQVEGVKLVFQKLRNILEGRGLKPIEAVGQPFNTDTQEAITEIPAPSPALSGKVVDEIQKGYTLNGTVIRYAKVVVGK